MISALSGFALIGVIVLAGLAARRWAGLPEHTEAVTGRLVYTMLAPCLLFTGAARADLHLLFTEPLGKMMVACAIVMQTIGFFWIRQVIKIEV